MMKRAFDWEQSSVVRGLNDPTKFLCVPIKDWRRIGLLTAGIVGGMIITLAIVAAIPTATKYLYPDGSCAIVVDHTDTGRVGHDCGWEVGRKFSVEYVGWKANLSALHGK